MAGTELGGGDVMGVRVQHRKGRNGIFIDDVNRIGDPMECIGTHMYLSNGDVGVQLLNSQVVTLGELREIVEKLEGIYNRASGSVVNNRNGV